eukprot:PhM_4_TR11050/c0_g1_i1/m.35412
MPEIDENELQRLQHVETQYLSLKRILQSTRVPRGHTLYYLAAQASVRMDGDDTTIPPEFLVSGSIGNNNNKNNNMNNGESSANGGDASSSNPLEIDFAALYGELKTKVNELASRAVSRTPPPKRLRSEGTTPTSTSVAQVAAVTASDVTRDVRAVLDVWRSRCTSSSRNNAGGGSEVSSPPPTADVDSTTTAPCLTSPNSLFEILHSTTIEGLHTELAHQRIAVWELTQKAEAGDKAMAALAELQTKCTDLHKELDELRVQVLSSAVMKDVAIPSVLSRANSCDPVEFDRLRNTAMLLRGRVRCKACDGAREVNRVLKCGHTLCSDCAERLIKERVRTCPSCLQRVLLAMDDTWPLTLS